jgi:uncharacterized protein YodC (DUF2158 family)
MVVAISAFELTTMSILRDNKTVTDEFQTGDVVQLKSGGPRMTVASTGEQLGELFVGASGLKVKRSTTESIRPMHCNAFESIGMHG